MSQQEIKNLNTETLSSQSVTKSGTPLDEEKSPKVLTDRAQELQQALGTLKQTVYFDFSRIESSIPIPIHVLRSSEKINTSFNEAPKFHFHRRQPRPYSVTLPPDKTSYILTTRQANLIIQEAKAAEELSEYTEICQQLANLLPNRLEYRPGNEYSYNYLTISKDESSGRPIFIANITENSTSQACYREFNLEEVNEMIKGEEGTSKSEDKEEEDPTVGWWLGTFMVLSTLTAVASLFTGTSILAQWNLITEGIENSPLNISTSDSAAALMLVPTSFYLLVLMGSLIRDTKQNPVKPPGATFASFFHYVKDGVSSLANKLGCKTNESTGYKKV